MDRNARRTFNTPGHAHELTFSTYRRLPVLVHDELRRIFVAKLFACCDRFAYDLWAYVVMPEHVHLVVSPRERDYRIEDFRSALRRESGRASLSQLRKESPDVAAGLRTPVGGPRFWQDGEGYDRNLWSSKAIWSSIEYIHSNPVRRGLCESPGDWPWSSARAYEGGPLDGVVLCPVPPYRRNDGVFRAYR